jgi:hypothetical protein
MASNMKHQDEGEDRLPQCEGRRAWVKPDFGSFDLTAARGVATYETAGDHASDSL